MDPGAIFGVTVLSLMWLPMTYALRAPPWMAALAAVGIAGSMGSIGDVLWAVPIAALVCAFVEKVFLSSALRVQLFAVLLMVLTSPLWVWPLTIGFALGVFYDRSLKNSLLLYRATALTLMVLVVAMHPGFWAQVEGSRAVLIDYLTPAMAMISFAIAAQIGSGALKRARAADRDRLFIVAEREIGGLMGRVTLRDSQPA